MLETGSQVGILTWGHASPRSCLRKNGVFCGCCGVDFHAGRPIHPRVRPRPSKSHYFLFLRSLFDGRPASSNTTCDDTGHGCGRSKHRIRAGSRSTLCPLGRRGRSRQRISHNLISFRRLGKFAIRARPRWAAGPGQESVAWVLELVRQFGYAATANFLEERQLLANLLQRRIPLPNAVLAVLKDEFRAAFLSSRHGWNQPRKEFVGYQPDNHRHRYGEGAENYRVTPLRTVDSVNGECLTTNEHDQALTSDNDELDPNEPPVVKNSFKDIEVVVQSPRAKKALAYSTVQPSKFSLLVLVENLHPHKRVENRALEAIFLVMSGI